MQSKSLSDRCFTHHLVTKAESMWSNKVTISKQFNTKLILELFKQVYQNGQSEMLFRERKGFVSIFSSTLRYLGAKGRQNSSSPVIKLSNYKR
jgi:hypothetical protein